MSTPTQSGERLIDFDGTFFRGMSSNGDPGQLPLGYYWNSMNMINTGGVLSCRPGYRCLVKFPKGNLQGGTIFRPKVGFEQMVVVIDGVVYVAPFPFLEFTILSNVQMLPYAKQVFFMQAVQSANRTNTSFSSPIEVIAPRNVLFIQDGGNTAPAWYDGSNSGHIRDNEFETPVGGPMMWVGDRLWVANQNRVYASDISNPFSFREQIYLGAVQGFEFSGDVTALAKTPSLESPQLAIFTHDNTSIIQANIRDRSLWPTTDGFQIEVLQVGCVGHRAVVPHYGRLSWFCPSGIVIFDFATAGKLSVRLPIRDNEMAFSKTRVSDNLDLIAGAAFGQYLLMSVPANDYYNKDTWVVNDAAFETLTDDSGPSWASWWRGTRPVEWIYGVIAGIERIYHVSFDEDEEIRLWEAFTPDRLDNGCPITWFAETRGYFGATSGVKKLPGADCRFQWADIAMSGIEEDLNLGVFVASSLRGGYKPIFAKKISVERGSLSFEREITATTKLFALKPEERTNKTQDANQQSSDNETGTCAVESENLEGIENSFQLLIIGHGPATIRWVRSWALSVSEDLSGNPTACQDEVPFNTVRFDGAGQHESNLVLAIDELSERELAYFTAVKTAVVEQDGFSAVGFGTAQSIISQAAADRVAGIVAIKQAESELRAVLPPVLSIGEGFDE
jgi:hypothetical protein